MTKYIITAEVDQTWFEILGQITQHQKGFTWGEVTPEEGDVIGTDSEKPCNKCGVMMERFSTTNSYWNHAEDRECAFTENMCEECCNCRQHN